MTNGPAFSHVTPEQIEGWRSRSLPVDEALQVSDHVSECEACAWKLSPRTPVQLETAFEDALDVDHVAADDAACEICRAEGEDLRSFVPARSRAFAWGAVAAVLVAATLTAILIGRGHGGSRAPTSAPVVARSAPRIVLTDGPLSIDDSGAPHGVPAPWNDRVAVFLSSPELPLPASLAAVQWLPESQRSDERTRAAVRPEAPVLRVVLEDRPEFRWSGPRGASYRVTIYDSSFARVAVSPPLAGTVWTPTTTLPRGRPLSWTVTRLGDDATAYPEPPDPPALFRLVTATEKKDVEDAISTGSRLVAAEALWRVGLTAEAHHELQRLLRENPDSPLAARLERASAGLAPRSR